MVDAWRLYRRRASFLLLGITAYILHGCWLYSALLICLIFSYLRERLWWSLIWAVVLLISVTGVLCVADGSGTHGDFRKIIGAPSLGRAAGRGLMGKPKVIILVYEDGPDWCIDCLYQSDQPAIP